MTFGKIGARRMMCQWHNPYITDGLVAMWDVNFVAPTQNIWEATVGEGIGWSLTGISIDADGGLQFAGTSSSYGELSAEQSALVWSNIGTLEIVYKMLTPPSENANRGGVLLKTPMNCDVGIGMFGSSSVANLSCRNNISGKAYGLSNTYGWQSYAGTTFQFAICYNSGVLSYYQQGHSIIADGTDNIGGSQTVTRLGNRTTTYPFHGNVYAIRFYSRILTDAEILSNARLDVARFDLPTT